MQCWVNNPELDWRLEKHHAYTLKAPRGGRRNGIIYSRRGQFLGLSTASAESLKPVYKAKAMMNRRKSQSSRGAS